MVKWEAFVSTLDNGLHAVMIRNHKTSHALVTFEDIRYARAQAVKINKYPFPRKAVLYKQAMNNDILCMKHEELDLTSQRLKPVTIEKGDGCYALLVMVGGRQYIIKKEKYKKDLKEWYRTKRLEYTEDEFVAKCAEVVQRRQSARR